MIASVASENFVSMMKAVGPFEATPHIAVAVSGGGDSMALCLLADAWARERGGTITALTVDHGLRRESMGEAAQVGSWLAARNIDHHILSWKGKKPVTGVQAAARMARYQLMTSWAAEAGVLHLLVAHTLEDQGETFLLRLERGSGFAGLSSMAAVLETPFVRIVRPFLSVSGECLRETLREWGQEWVEDPSNKNQKFTRTHLRAAVVRLGEKGIEPQRLATLARNFGQVRKIMEAAVSALLAQCCTFHPAGYAFANREILASAPHEVSLRTLARLLVCIGGGIYPPGREKLARLHDSILRDSFNGAMTLGGCRVHAMQRGQILICREARGKGKCSVMTPGTRVEWDGRFSAELTSVQSGDDQVSLSRLGRDGWAEVVAEQPEIRNCTIPRVARASLPALRDSRGILLVPHLNYRRVGDNSVEIDIKRILFHPPNSVSGVGFFVV